MYLRNMLMRLVLVITRSVFTIFIDILWKGGAMVSGFLLVICMVFGSFVLIVAGDTRLSE